MPWKAHLCVYTFSYTYKDRLLKNDLQDKTN